MLIRDERRELRFIEYVQGIETVQELLYKIFPKYYKLSIIILYMRKSKHKKSMPSSDRKWQFDFSWVLADSKCMLF